MEANNRITPDWIETLAENEIFVFGCRNSGRHFDGASNFALKHFGAVMGQRRTARTIIRYSDYRWYYRVK